LFRNPFSPNTTSATLINFLGDAFQYWNLSDENAFLGAFSRNISVAALSLASPLVLTQPISDGAIIDLASASHDEWIPLFFYAGFLCIYGFAALTLSIVAFLSSPAIVHVAEAAKTAELLKLPTPLVIIADQFADSKDIGRVVVRERRVVDVQGRGGRDPDETGGGAHIH
jgi:hypothetical protein